MFENGELNHKKRAYLYPECTKSESASALCHLNDGIPLSANTMMMIELFNEYGDNGNHLKRNL